MSRVRSPAYPSLSLPAAIDAIRKVHALQHRTPEPRDVVLRHMGYGSENGRALKAISALIKYGFLEKHGDGLRVSERALAILFPESEADKTQALHEAANEPALYAEILTRWEGRPSEEALRSFLIRKGFNQNSVDHVARAFYDTFNAISGIGGPYYSVNVDETDEDVEGEPVQDQQTQGDKGQALASGRKIMEGSHSLASNMTRPIFDFETVRVNTVIDNRDDLDELIARLQQLSGMLPEKRKP